MPEPVLYFVIPCYNEEKVIETTAARVTEKLDVFIASGQVSAQSRLCFLDDGSTDRTWDILQQMSRSDDRIVVLRHNRNYGEQYAYLSGIRFAAKYADVLITMDADLQDDIGATDAMLDAYFKGNDVVYGARSSRKQDRRFQRITSGLFYHFMRMCGTKLVPEHSQYRLMSRRAAQKIAQNTEKRIFLPAFVPLLRLPETVVYYERKPREAGESHYNVRSLIRLASNAILSYGVNLPYFLLILGIVDVIFAAVAVWLLCAGRDHTLAAALLSVCIPLAILSAAMFYVAKKEMRRHLRAKKRPENKNPQGKNA